jgi:hypothetical protein
MQAYANRTDCDGAESRGSAAAPMASFTTHRVLPRGRDIALGVA